MSDAPPAISLKGLGKKYEIFPSRQARLKEALTFGRSKHHKDYWVLQDLNLDVEPGTTLGVVGRNGAGKSTLLKIISGVLRPTTGTVELNGRLVALFGMGSGFNAQFTGRENAMLNGLLLGIDRKEMLERFDEIEAFAGIGEFIDQPVKTYSSGMRARLGFAVAVNVQPDILILDETLSVGDALFKQASLQKMRDLRDVGTTILFVSHSLGMVRNFCNKAILLHNGGLAAFGDAGETLDRYEALLSGTKVGKNSGGDAPGDRQEYEVWREDEEDAATTDAPVFAEDPALAAKGAQGLRHGTGEAAVRKVEVLNGLGRPAGKVPSGSTLTVRVHAEYLEDVEGSSVEVIVRNRAGIEVFSTSTRREDAPLGARARGERVVVDFAFEAPFKPDDYNVSAAVSRPRGEGAPLDRVDVAAAFRITRPEDGAAPAGLVGLPATVAVHDAPDRAGASGGAERGKPA